MALRLTNDFASEFLGFKVLNPMIMGILLGFIFGRHLENEKKLYQMALHDNLSGLYNRHGFSTLMDNVFLDSTKPISISIITFDIDDFKSINDIYGHDSGDNAITLIGSILKKNTRSIDISARLGGDEFVVALPRTSHNDAMNVAHKLNTAISSSKLMSSTGVKIPITVSIGVATSESKVTNKSLLLKASDNQLFKSKRSGKNTVFGELM